MTATAVAPLRSIPDYVPPMERTLGVGVVLWCHEYLTQPDGENTGERWQFTDEQQRIILRWYEIDDRGRFRYRRGVIRRLKGWGKDPIAAAIVCAELCGPVRFGGWDAAGMPVGVEHPRPWVIVAAVNQAQTGNTTLLFEGMMSSEMVTDYKLDLGKTVIYAAGRGKVEAVTSSPRALEGARPTLTIAAETQNWLANNDGHDMERVIRRNLAKARGGGARLLEINNAHLIGEDSVAERTYEAWRKAAPGVLTDLYYDAVEGPVTDLADGEQLAAGIEACRGDAVWLDIEHLVAEAQDPTTSDSDTRRFYLNQPAQMLGELWMDDELWDARTEGFEEIADFTEVVIAFDGSHSGDATAIVVATLEEIPRIGVVAAWEPTLEADPDYQVPVEDVEDAIRAACRKYKVREIACDPSLWMRSFQILQKERLPVVEFPNTPSRMIPATKMFMQAVVNGRLRQSGDDRLRRHILNAVLKTSSRGGMIFKDSKTSPRKIDLAIAAIMGLERAVHYTRRVAGVYSFGDVFSENGEKADLHAIEEAQREEYDELMRLAAEDRKAIDESLGGKPIEDEPATSDEGAG